MLALQPERQDLVENLLDSLEAKISIFNLYEIVSRFAKKNWTIFKNRETNTKRNFVTAASWLCFIAIGSRNPHGLDAPTQQQEEELVQMLLDAFECINELGYSLQIVEGLVKQLMSSSGNTILEKNEEKLRNLLSNFCHEAHSRLLNREIDTKYTGVIPLCRPLLILNEAEKIAPEKLNKTLEKEFGTASGEKLCQLLYLVLKIFINQNGIINSATLASDDNIQDIAQTPEEVNELKSSILILLERLSSTKEDIENSYKNFKEHIKARKILLHDANPFYNKPFCKLIFNGEQIFICPSPYVFLWSLSWLPISKIDFSRNKNNRDIFAGYVKGFLEYYLGDITDLDEGESCNSEEKADFLIETENYIFIIECKNSLSLRTPPTNEAKDEKSPIADRFKRINKGISQCNSTQESKKLDDTGKIIFTLIITNETVLAEPVAFFLAACRGQLNGFKGRCGEFSVLSISQFENLVISGNLEKFAKECKSHFQKHEDLSLVEFREALKILGFDFFERQDEDLDLSFFDEANKRLGT